MYALISKKDGGMLQVSINGHSFVPLFKTLEEADLFRYHQNINCLIEKVSVSN